MLHQNKKIDVTSNKILQVFDDLFSYTERVKLLEHFMLSFYRVNGSDSDFHSKQQIYSPYSLNDLDNIKLRELSGFKNLNEKYQFQSRPIKQIRVNCSTSAEHNHIHTDKEGITFLYYANLQWDVTWGGHTMFFSEDLNEISYTCLYKPGRIVVFDGTIPHMIMSPTIMCPVNRFSFAIQYGV